MKKIFCTVFALALSVTFCAATCAYSNEVQRQGGYNGPTQGVNSSTTVVEALKLKNDSFVRLEGNIVSKIAHEKYTFKDKTGTVQIDIDDDIWYGIKADANDTVVIEGELDKDWNLTSIDVNRIMLATPTR